MQCIDPKTRAGRAAGLPGLGALAGAAVLALTAGCTLGPQYEGPPQVAPQAVSAAQLQRAGQAGVVAASPPAQWWRTLGDDALASLIDQALQGNPNLRAADARLQASRALLSQRRAEMLPSVGASAGYTYLNAPRSLERGLDRALRGAAEAGGSDPNAVAGVDLDTELYTVALDASWEIDLFGRRQRATEGALAQAGADEAALADAQVRLAAELGQVYVGYRADQRRLALAQDGLAKVVRMLELTRQRRAQGVATEIEIERLVLQQRQEEARLPQLEAQLQVALDQMALITGQVPGALDARLAGSQALPRLPAEVAVDDAASLIRRRPDVRRAERELAASTAQIGEALSGYFPQVRLLGLIGLGATSPSGLTADSAAVMVSPMLSWSLLDFGRVRARVDQARAGREARLASYEGTVLAALQDANGALARFGAARRQWATAGQAQASAERARDLVQQRYAAGAATLIDALDTQRQALNAQDQDVGAQAQLLANYIALQKTLGLGWQQPAGV